MSPSRWLGVLLAGVTLLLMATCAEARNAGFLWRIERISAQAVHQGVAPSIGSHLLLHQQLRAGETGWTEMKIAMPRHWSVARVFGDGESLLIELSDGRRFQLHRHNIGALSTRVLGVGVRLPEAEIESAWQAIAAVAAGRDGRPRP